MRLLRGHYFVLVCILAVVVGFLGGAGWSGKSWQLIGDWFARAPWPAAMTVSPAKSRHQLVSEIDNGPDGFATVAADVLRILTQGGFCGGGFCSWTRVTQNNPFDGNYGPGEFIAVKLADIGDKLLPKVYLRVEHAETSSTRAFSLAFRIETDDAVVRTKEAFLPALAERFDFDPKTILDACAKPSEEPVYSRRKENRFVCVRRPVRKFEDGKIFMKERFEIRFDSAVRCGRLTGKRCP